MSNVSKLVSRIGRGLCKMRYAERQRSSRKGPSPQTKQDYYVADIGRISKRHCQSVQLLENIEIRNPTNTSQGTGKTAGIDPEFLMSN